MNLQGDVPQGCFFWRWYSIWIMNFALHISVGTYVSILPGKYLKKKKKKWKKAAKSSGKVKNHMNEKNKGLYNDWQTQESGSGGGSKISLMKCISFLWTIQNKTSPLHFGRSASWTPGWPWLWAGSCSSEQAQLTALPELAWAQGLEHLWFMDFKRLISPVRDSCVFCSLGKQPAVTG